MWTKASHSTESLQVSTLNTLRSCPPALRCTNRACP